MRVIQKPSVLWTVQGLLAALFLFAGASKFMMPIEAMQQGPIALPAAFLYFIGAAECLGALGLVLPGLLRIRRDLTPVAAVGLVIIMSGATTITIESGIIGGAAVPFVVGLLATLVVFGRRQWVSLPVFNPALQGK